jgi:predicted transglutaminase-like cysteine proteinase
MVRNLAFYFVLAMFLSGFSGTASAVSFMPVGDAVQPPKGFVDFCRRHPDECSETIAPSGTFRLTPARRAEMVAVHQAVNGKILYKSDVIHYGKLDFWAFPKWWGDCEDFALEKKRRLQALGWPHSTLLLTTVRTAKGRLHMVLIAKTGDGEFALDNRLKAVKEWSELDYTWLRRQSRTNESQWVSLTPSEPHLARDANGAVAEPARKQTD